MVFTYKNVLKYRIFLLNTVLMYHTACVTPAGRKKNNKTYKFCFILEDIFQVSRIILEESYTPKSEDANTVVIGLWH